MKFKKHVKLILIFMVTFVLFGVEVNAADTYYNDAQTFNYTSNSAETQNLLGGVTFIHENGYTTRNNGALTKNQDIFMLFQKSDASKGMKTATWAVYDGNNATSSKAYVRKTLENIAKDYEENNPGWKVLGGINADQYYQYYGTRLGENGSELFYNQPYYPMISNGDNLFSVTPYGYSSNIVGFKNDGSTNPLVQGNRSIAGMFLTIYDDNGEVVKKVSVDGGLNPTSESYQTAVHFLYNADTTAAEINITRSIDVSASSLYIIENAEKAYVSNSSTWTHKNAAWAIDTCFGKGEISKVDTSYTLRANQFAVSSNDEEVKNYLKEGTTVKVELEFDAEMEVVEEGMGYHLVQRRNNADVYNGGGSYNDRSYPRSVMGCTSDGQIVLMASNGTGNATEGMDAREINALCKKYDITDAFQMDGGGSVTMIVRNNSGGFDTVTKPSDGSNRSIFSGLFFVVKADEIDISEETITSESVSLGVEVTKYADSNRVPDNIYVTVSGPSKNETVKVVENKVSFSGLMSNSEYQYIVVFEYGEERQNTFTSGKIKTAKNTPSIRSVSIEYEDNTLKMRVVPVDGDKAILGVLQISFDGGTTFTKCDTSQMLSVENPNFDIIGNIIVKVKYDINDGNNEQELEISDIVLTYSVSSLLQSIVYNYETGIMGLINEEN